MSSSRGANTSRLRTRSSAQHVVCGSCCCMAALGRRMMSDRIRLSATLDAALAVAWGGFGLWASATGRSQSTVAVIVIVVLTSLAVGLFRRAPAAALLLVWLAGLIQVLSLTDLLAAQAGVLLAAYGTARYGRPLTVWLGGISVPVGAALAEYYVFQHSAVLPSAVSVVTPLLRHTGLGVASVFLLGSAIAGIPWAVGVLGRLNARYQRSTAEQDLALARAAAAEQTAHLRAQQAKLARDVHDLVGHSLAVIIAQADAAQLAAGEPGSPARLALENIAAVARSSLGEVRNVLTHTQDAGNTTVRAADLNTLVDRARAAGNKVAETTHGTPTELPPQIQATLYRVLQEMLTNAIKHGPQAGIIGIAHTWEPTAYTVGVTNLVRHARIRSRTMTVDADTATAGMGLSGMRARLEEIGGTLGLSRPDDAGAASFAATARIPLEQYRGRT